MNKILTISIAAYNVEKYIESVLDSLIVPSIMDKLEVLIINDGSTDDTIQKCQKYVDEYPQTFFLVNKENGGWGSTVNEGIKKASGKYFKLLDGDDYFANLESFIGVLENNEADLVYTPYVVFYEDSDETERHALNSSLELEKVLDVKSDFFGKEFAMHSCAFKTELLKKIKITEHCFYTDIEYILKGIENVKTVYFCDIDVYYYRLGRTGQSASIEGYRKHSDEHLKVLLKLLKRYKKLDSNSEIFSIFRNRLGGMVDLEYSILLHLLPSKKNAHTMKRFDSVIKENYPEFYESTRKRVQVFRKIGVISYPFIVYR